uniref:Uncharacterized protein n=1 Tax=Arundo donax TaxID=35708 RepID=A0A0A8ZAB2_ARUDO
MSCLPGPSCHTWRQYLLATKTCQGAQRIQDCYIQHHYGNVCMDWYPSQQNSSWWPEGCNSASGS